jgi:cytochrome c oxidase subunit 2
MTPRSRLGLLLLGLALAVSGCGGNQNVVDPHSHSQHEISNLFWALLVGSTIGFSLIVVLLFLGWLRRTREELPGGIGETGATKLVLGLGVALPIVLLSILFVWSDFFVMRSTAAPAVGSSRLTIRVIGHDWWWEVRYPERHVVTANEIHIPTNTRVTVVGTTADVIHSFWVPELNKKIDLVPGNTNRVLLGANSPGRYRGQCAEFCGLQHAHMAVLVVAEPMGRFRRWLDAEAKPAQGEAPRAFERGGCDDCHTVRGTDARGDVGPDLTHLASRLTLAANTIPNTPQYLEQWIRDPQHFKPGNKMPNLQLSDADWSALTAYLGTLR